LDSVLLAKEFLEFLEITRNFLLAFPHEMIHHGSAMLVPYVTETHHTSPTLRLVQTALSLHTNSRCEVSCLSMTCEGDCKDSSCLAIGYPVKFK
jgi:hypothetical protein